MLSCLLDTQNAHPENFKLKFEKKKKNVDLENENDANQQLLKMSSIKTKKKILYKLYNLLICIGN